MIIGIETIVISVFLMVVWRWYKLWNYWCERGVKSYGYPPPVGIVFEVCMGHLSFAQLPQKIFSKNPETGLIGSWILTEPILFVKDQRCVHQILSEDFTTWPDRGFRDNPALDPLSQHLINIAGDKWKAVRSWLASGFGLIAMRSRYDLLLGEADNLVSSITSEENVDINMDMVSKRSVFSVLTQITFGAKSFSSEVEALVNDAFSASLWTSIRSIFRMACPFILSCIGSKRFCSEHETSFIEFVDRRYKSDEHENQDMLQTLINSYKQHLRTDSNNNGMCYELVGSNAFAMLAAGYDTTANTLSWMLFELGRHPEVQDRLHDEVHSVLASHGSLTQASLKEMDLLNNIVSETLRLYPSACLTSRVCRKKTTLKGVELDSGTRVIVPIYAIHRDSDNFPSPDSFDPDRFCRTDFNKTAYLPFGKGPRICLGWRLAELMLKIYAVALVKDYKLSLSPKMKLPVIYKTRSLFLGPKHPILLRLKPRN